MHFRLLKIRPLVLLLALGLWGALGCASKNSSAQVTAARGAAREALRQAKLVNAEAYEIHSAVGMMAEGEKAYIEGRDAEAFRLFRDAEDLGRSVSGYFASGPRFIPEERDIFHLNTKPRPSDPIAFLDHLPEVQWLRPREDLRADQQEKFPWENQKEAPRRPKVHRFLEDEEEDPIVKNIERRQALAPAEFTVKSPAESTVNSVVASDPGRVTTPEPSPTVSVEPEKLAKPALPVKPVQVAKAAFPTARKVADIKKEGLSVLPLEPVVQQPLNQALAFKERMPGAIAFGVQDKVFQSSSRRYLDALGVRLKNEPRAVAVFQGQIGEGESIDIVEDRFDMVKRYLLEAGVDETRLSLDDKRLVGDWPEMKIFLLK